MTISSALALLSAGDAFKAQPGLNPDPTPASASPAQPVPAEIAANLFSSVLGQLIPDANGESIPVLVKDQSTPSPTVAAPANTSPTLDLKPKSRVGGLIPENEVRPAALPTNAAI